MISIVLKDHIVNSGQDALLKLVKYSYVILQKCLYSFMCLIILFVIYKKYTILPFVINSCLFILKIKSDTSNVTAKSNSNNIKLIYLKKQL